MNRFRTFFAFIVVLSFLLPVSQTVAAQPGPRLETLDHQIISEVKDHRAQPKTGWVRGTIGGKTYDITFDRVAWTITGSNGQYPYNLKIDHQGKTIRGESNNEPINLSFEWSPDQVILDGDAYSFPYHVEVNWKDGTAVGGIACGLLKTSFDLEKGTFTGYVADKNLNVTYDKATGRVKGEFFKRQMDIVLTNLDFSDFIQHMYVFIR